MFSEHNNQLFVRQCMYSICTSIQLLCRKNIPHFVGGTDKMPVNCQQWQFCSDLDPTDSNPASTNKPPPNSLLQIQLSQWLH